jgi:hypothetical protein
MATLELNCLVFGYPDRLFTVGVPNTGRISQLQEAVKKQNEPELDHVPAHALKLWKVACDVIAVNRC